jgi:hypothetical protein
MSEFIINDSGNAIDIIKNDDNKTTVDFEVLGKKLLIRKRHLMSAMCRINHHFRTVQEYARMVG